MTDSSSPNAVARAARRLWREPLLLFVLLGAGVFVLERSCSPSDHLVEIGAEEVARLRGLWRAQSGREPNAEELETLIEGDVREEILYREAKSLGLDRDDIIVRRRLAQKMGFLIEDSAGIAEPTTDELEQYFEDHLERYRPPPRLTLTHVYFSTERRGGDAAAATEAAKNQLRSAGPPPWRRLGDPFMLRREYAGRTEQELTELFGGSFVESVRSLPLGTWEGPIRSAYGLHLVRVLERTEPELPAFAEVRERVLDDYRNEARKLANDRYYEDLRSRYRVVIRDQDELASTTPPGGVER